VRDDIEVSKLCLGSFVEEVTELFIRSLTTSKVKGDRWFIGALTDKTGLAAKIFDTLGQREAHTSRVFVYRRYRRERLVHLFKILYVCGNPSRAKRDRRVADTVLFSSMLTYSA